MVRLLSEIVLHISSFVYLVVFVEPPLIDVPLILKIFHLYRRLSILLYNIGTLL